MAFGPKGGIEVHFGERAEITHHKRLALCIVLFVFCLLAVLRVVHYGAVTAVVFLTLLLADRAALKQVDYCLLLTFVFFFIFAGNIGNIPAVNDALSAMLDDSSFFTSLLASQVISNVPAAVLLAGFTSDWKGLLLGVDVGGLGTLIASLASLISFKLYCATPGAGGEDTCSGSPPRTSPRSSCSYRCRCSCSDAKNGRPEKGLPLLL